MNYNTNQCSEYAMKDSEGEKLDIKAINTAIEAVKSGSVPYFASIDDIPIVEGAPQIPNVFGFENAIAMKFDQTSFVTFYIEDDGNIHTINHSYNTINERWNEYIIYEDMYLTDLGGTKLYKHEIVLQDYPTGTLYQITQPDLTISSSSLSWSYLNKIIYIISTKSTPYENLASISREGFINGWFNLSSGNIYDIVSLPTTGSPTFRVDRGIECTITCASKTAFTDTVTPL